MNTVKFVGGELDGQSKEMPHLASMYCCPWRPRPPRLQEPDLLDRMPTPQVTTYLLTVKDGSFFYVERELMKLSEDEGIDPRDA